MSSASVASKCGLVASMIHICAQRTRSHSELHYKPCHRKRRAAFWQQQFIIACNFHQPCVSDKGTETACAVQTNNSDWRRKRHEKATYHRDCPMFHGTGSTQVCRRPARPDPARPDEERRWHEARRHEQ